MLKVYCAACLDVIWEPLTSDGKWNREFTLALLPSGSVPVVSPFKYVIVLALSV